MNICYLPYYHQLLERMKCVQSRTTLNCGRIHRNKGNNLINSKLNRRIHLIYLSHANFNDCDKSRRLKLSHQ